MIAFRRRTLLERLLRLIPAYRRKQDEETAAAIRGLCADPSLPCEIEGEYIPDGFGGRMVAQWTGTQVPPGWQWYGMPQSGWIIKL